MLALGFAFAGHTIIRPAGVAASQKSMTPRRIFLMPLRFLRMPLKFTPTKTSDGGLAKEEAKCTMPLVPMSNDDASTDIMANNPTPQFRCCRIATRYFQIRNYVRDLRLRPYWITTSKNIADVFTKAPGSLRTFEDMWPYCGMEDLE